MTEGARRRLAVRRPGDYIHAAMSPAAITGTDGAGASAKPATPLRRLSEAAAALTGIAAGVLFAEPVLAAAGAVWRGYVLPAYDELIKNGLLAWCM